MRAKLYPDDYVGPKAGESTDEEWLAVRPIQAMRWIVDGTWAYCDFDCYVYARCEETYQLGYKEGKESIKKK
jgi:hypothetical protein